MNKFSLSSKKRFSSKRLTSSPTGYDSNAGSRNIITFSQKERKENTNMSSVTSNEYCRFVHMKGIELDVLDDNHSVLSTIKLFESVSMSSYIPGWTLAVNKVNNKLDLIKELDHELTQIKIVSHNEEENDIDVKIPESLKHRLEQLDFGTFVSVYNGYLNQHVLLRQPKNGIMLGLVRLSGLPGNYEHETLQSDNPMFQDGRPYSLSDDSSIL